MSKKKRNDLKSYLSNPDPSLFVMCMVLFATCLAPLATTLGPFLVSVSVTRVPSPLPSFPVVASWTGCTTATVESGQAPTWSRGAPTKRPS